MTDSEAPSTVELLAELELRNRRFKFASAAFSVAVIAGLVILLIICVSTLSAVNRQLASQKTLLSGQNQTLSKISAASKQRTTQINDLEQHIDCVVELFQQPNRQNLTITDLEGCQISANGTVVSSGTVSSGGSNAGTPQATNNTGTTPQSTAPAQSSTTNTTPTTPTQTQSGLDQVPVLGRVFKAIGL